MPRQKPSRPARLDNEQRRRQQWNMGQRQEEGEGDAAAGGGENNYDIIQGELEYTQYGL